MTNGQWQNRIIRYGEEAPDQLLAHPLNSFKIHPKGQQDAMSGVLNETGWLAPIIVSEATGKVIDGHMRVSLAISRNEPSVPVAYVRLTPEEEVAALATFDPIGALVAYDKTELDALLRDVSTGDEAVQKMLSELAAKNGLYPDGVTDPMGEWQGMPEFEQEDKTSFRRIVVHFATQEDVNQFAGLVAQKIGEKTRAIWYPEAAKTNMVDVYDDE